MSPANLGFPQNAPDLLLPSALLDLEYLYQLLPETPSGAGSAHGTTPNSPPSHAPDPSSPPPQVTAPVDDRTTICVVCSASASLPPPIPQAATIPPPNWHKIPQKTYDHGRKQWNYTPSECISFGVNGRPGVNMGDALRKRFTGLDGRDDPVLRDAGKVISCRFSVRLS